MADKDVDEQFAAIMAHWHEDARGLDPFGDPAEATGPSDGADAGAGGGGAGDLEASDGHGIELPAAPTTEADVLPDVLPDVAARPAPVVEPPAPTVNPAPALSPERVSGLAWRQHVPQDDQEDHFVPPPPAPLPSSDDKHFWLMLAGLVGGPLLFLYLILFNRDGNGWWMVCGILMTIAGFVLLVLRQPFERDQDDDGVRL